MDLQKLCSVEEAAEALGRDPSLVRRFCREKRIKAKPIGKRGWVIDRKDLDRFMAEDRPSGRPPQNPKKKTGKCSK